MYDSSDIVAKSEFKIQNNKYLHLNSELYLFNGVIVQPECLDCTISILEVFRICVFTVQYLRFKCSA